MKNLLLILLLANILYFVYGLVSEGDERRGEITVDETQLGPKLELADSDRRDEPIEIAQIDVADQGTSDDIIPIASDTETDEASDDPSAVEDVPETPQAETPREERPPVELTAVIGRSCVTLGPLRQRDDADRAQIQYINEGMRAEVRSTIGTRQVGNWVLVRDIPSYDEAQSMLKTLKDGGLVDAYIAETDEEGIKIYLGLFSQASGAERIELQATSLGVPAVIVPEVREGSIYFVDIALPPGRGAGEMVQKYGEENVLLREQASCPNGV